MFVFLFCLCVCTCRGTIFWAICLFTRGERKRAKAASDVHSAEYTLRRTMDVLICLVPSAITSSAGTVEGTGMMVAKEKMRIVLLCSYSLTVAGGQAYIPAL
jgi:hypothetical protein